MNRSQLSSRPAVFVREYADQTLVNKTLRDARGVVQDRIAEYYASGLGILGRLLGNLDEELTGFSFETWREHAWHSGIALVAAQGNPKRPHVEALVESQATLLAKSTLLPNTRFAWLIEVLRQIEQMKPWFEPEFERLESAPHDVEPRKFVESDMVVVAPRQLPLERA